MPFALIFIAVALIVAGFRGTQRCLFSLLQQDAGGQFLLWGGAIVVVGGIGYVKTLEPISTALLVLLIIVLILGHGGVFQQLTSALKSGAAPTVVQPASSNTVSSFSMLNTNTGNTGLPGLPPLGTLPSIGTGGLY